MMDIKDEQNQVIIRRIAIEIIPGYKSDGIKKLKDFMTNSVVDYRDYKLTSKYLSDEVSRLLERMENDEKPKPPKKADMLLDFIFPLNEQDAIIGDLEQRFQNRIERHGEKIAVRWYWYHVLSVSLHAIGERLRSFVAWIAGMAVLLLGRQ